MKFDTVRVLPMDICFQILWTLAHFSGEDLTYRLLLHISVIFRRCATKLCMIMGSDGCQILRDFGEPSSTFFAAAILCCDLCKSSLMHLSLLFVGPSRRPRRRRTGDRYLVVRIRSSYKQWCLFINFTQYNLKKPLNPYKIGILRFLKTKNLDF